MFTGLVEAFGVLSRRSGQPVARAVFECSLGELSLGESINVNGVCLTVDRIHPGGFEADLSTETREKTTLDSIAIGQRVHLERATPLGGRMGGHVVLGHVDGLGEVVAREPVGEAVRLTIAAPAGLARFIASKGSIAVNGVSLTVNDVSKGAHDRPVRFDVMLVPHTLARTLVGQERNGARVNLEIDVLARYVARQLEFGETPAEGAEQADDHGDRRILEKLRAGGFV